MFLVKIVQKHFELCSLIFKSSRQPRAVDEMVWFPHLQGSSHTSWKSHHFYTSSLTAASPGGPLVLFLLQSLLPWGARDFS